MLVNRFTFALFALAYACVGRGAPAAPAAHSHIAVIAPVTACAPAERNYAASLSKHLVRWLAGNGVQADLTDDTSLSSALADRKIVFLVMCSTPSRTQLEALRAYRKNGGRLVSFYSVSPDLASFFGVKLGAYRKRTGSETYSKIVFNRAVAPAEAPTEILQSSANIFTALPVNGKSNVIAAWHDRLGRPTGDAAVLASDVGWWVTHVFLADGDEDAKARFLLACIGASAPGEWNVAQWKKQREDRAAADRALGRAQKKRPGEIHAVWDHSGQGLYPGDWPRTVRELKAAGVSDLFVNVCGAGFAHYPSRVLPPSPVCETEGDQLAACLAAAKGSGIRVHAWMLCFNATRATKNRLAVFSKNKWRLRNAQGVELDYLDPSDPALRDYLLRAVDELAARYDIAGVHLDFVRWYEQIAVTEASPEAMARFRASSPKDASRRALCNWRTRQVTTFVQAARDRLRVRRPSAWLTTAVLGKYPSCVDAVGQDWEAWLDAGLVQYVLPMDYTEDPKRFEEFVKQHARTKAHANRTIAGIGVTANESRLTPAQVIAQIAIARRYGLAGVAFFDLDHTLMKRIFPILSLGMF